MPRQEAATAAPLIPPEPTPASLRAAAAGCTACPLFADATQTVFGEGPPDAPLMLVGEQPGDKEDLDGHPFVGPAGRMLDRCLEEAGIDRGLAWVTNAVKHFKWTRSGKRRMHARPAPAEIRACRPWLDAEIAVVRPRVLVAMGATAAQALLGPDFRVSVQRGQLLDSPLAPYVLATVHPSSLLRAEPDRRHEERMRFVDDLRVIAPLLAR